MRKLNFSSVLLHAEKKTFNKQNKVHKCLVCGREFTNKKELKAHKYSEHSF